MKFKSDGKIKEIAPEKLLGKCIVLDSEEGAKAADQNYKKNYKDSNVVFGYLFNHPNSGLAFLDITTGYKDENNEIKMHDVPQNDELISVFLYSSVDNVDFMFLDEVPESFHERIGLISNLEPEYQSEFIKNAEELDPFRDRINPCLVTAVLERDGVSEKVRVLLNSCANDMFSGFLLSQPNNDLGIEAGDNVFVSISENGDELYIDLDFEDLNATQILIDIRSRLKGMGRLDRALLKESFDKYQGNEYLANEILDLYKERLSPIESFFFKSSMEEDNPFIDEIIDMSIENKFTNLLDDEINLSESYKNEDTHYYHFDNVVEFELCNHFLSFDFNSAFLNKNDRLDDLYFAKGIVNFMNGNIDEAKRLFKKALEINPVSVSKLGAVADFYLMIDEVDVAKQLIDDAFKYAWDKRSLIVLYKELSEYFAKTNQIELIPIADSYIDYYKGQIDKPLKHEGVPAGLSDEMKETILKLAQNAEGPASFQQAYCLFKAYYENFDDSPEILEKVNEYANLVIGV